MIYKSSVWLQDWRLVPDWVKSEVRALTRNIHLILSFHSLIHGVLPQAGQGFHHDPDSFTCSHLFPKLKKIQPYSNNSLCMVAQIPTGTDSGRDFSPPLSLLAANIWFPAMIHGGALASPSSSSSPSAVVWDGIGFCGKGKKVFGVSRSLMESYPAGQGQDMFRWWRWWLRGMRKGGGGVHICERGCLSPGALPSERKRGELEGGWGGWRGGMRG